MPVVGGPMVVVGAQLCTVLIAVAHGNMELRMSVCFVSQYGQEQACAFKGGRPRQHALPRFRGHHL